MITVIVAFLLVISVPFLRWYRRKKFFPSGPRGVPLFGVLPFMGKSPPKKLAEWRKRYGDVFTVRMGEHDFVAIADYDLVYELNVRHGSKVIHRPPLYIFDVCAQKLGLIFGCESVWHPMRTFVTNVFRRFNTGKKVIESAITDECEYVLAEIQKKEAEPFNPNELICYAALNVTTAILFGQRFNYDDEELKELLQRLVRGFHEHPMEVHMLAFCPKMRFVPHFAETLKNFRADYQYILDFSQKFYREHLETYDENEIRDFLDAYIKETKTEGHNQHFTEDEMGYVVKDLLEGGTQTSAAAILWSFVALMRHPEYQDRIKEEVENVVGEGKKLSMTHRENMHFTSAFITEILRRCTMFSNSIVQTSDNVELAGMNLPKGTPILNLIWHIHHDPKYYDDPESFRPERHLDDDGVYRKPKHFIPFSLGKRNCVGEHIAQQEMFSLIVNIVRRFKIRNVGDLPRLDDGLYGIVYIPPTLEFQFIERE